MLKRNDNAKDQSESRKLFQRKRYLNVIYFIDSNRTRTLKFSIGASYMTVGSLAAAVVWALISTSLLIHDRFVISDLKGHTRSLLELVFNYQTRYDEVYEKAYPAAPTATLTDETIPAPNETKLAEKVVMLAEKDKILAIANPKDKAVSQGSKDPPISIDNFSTQFTNKNLLIKLSLKNLNSPHKTSGAVTAKATFVGSDKKSFELTSHPARLGDDKSNDENFNIRNFKNKAFYFEPPKEVSGRFLSVIVTIKDESGRAKDFSYPLNKEVKAEVQATNPATAITPVHVAAPTIAAPPPSEDESEIEASPVVKASDTEAMSP